jgi:hypothetical protein
MTVVCSLVDAIFNHDGLMLRSIENQSRSRYGARALSRSVIFLSQGAACGKKIEKHF